MACFSVGSHRDAYVADALKLDASSGLRKGRAEDMAREISEHKTLSLADCLRLALYRSKDLKVRAERVVFSNASRRLSISALLPTVTAHGRFTQAPRAVRFLVSEIPATRLESWFSVTQPVFDGPAIAALAVARETREIDLLELARERDQLMFLVAGSFYDVLAAEADRAVLGVSIQRATEQFRITEVQVKAGQVGVGALIHAQVAVEQANASAFELEGEIQKARMQLAQLVGLDSLNQKLQESYEILWQPGSLPRLVESAQQRRQDLEIARRTLAREKASKRQVRADYLPKVTANGVYWARRQDLEQNVEWTVMVNADWTVYDGGAREARNAMARSAVRTAEVELERSEDHLRFEVESAFTSFQSLERLATLLESRVVAAEETHSRVSKSVEVGTAIELDLMIADEARQDAQRALDRARYARVLALLRIRLRIGDLHETLEE